MLRLLAPLLEAVLRAALSDPEFCAWLIATDGEPMRDALKEVQGHLDQLVGERGW